MTDNTHLPGSSCQTGTRGPSDDAAIPSCPAPWEIWPDSHSAGRAQQQPDVLKKMTSFAKTAVTPPRTGKVLNKSKGYDLALHRVRVMRACRK